MSQETVEVTLKLPKVVVDFWRDQKDNLEEGLAAEIVDLCYAALEAVTPGMIADKYPGLRETFKKYGLDTKYL